jgi:hypothetical protein
VELLVNFFEKTVADGFAMLFFAERKPAKIGNRERTVGQSFVALTARGYESGITAFDGFVWRFAFARLKSAAPKNRLRIVKIAIDEKLLFVRGDRQVNHEHLLAKTMEKVVANVDDAAGGVENQFMLRMLFQAGENRVQGGDFLGQISGFALGIGGLIGPAHPGGDAVDAGVAADPEVRLEAFLDLRVATDEGVTGGRNAAGPIGLSRAGHADQGEAQRLIGIRPHRSRSYRINRNGEKKTISSGAKAQPLLDLNVGAKAPTPSGLIYEMTSRKCKGGVGVKKGNCGRVCYEISLWKEDGERELNAGDAEGAEKREEDQESRGFRSQELTPTRRRVEQP